MNINNKFNIGDLVYVVTDKEQHPGLISSILLNPKDIIYFVSRDAAVDRFFDFELTSEENKLIKL